MKDLSHAVSLMNLYLARNINTSDLQFGFWLHFVVSDFCFCSDSQTNVKIIWSATILENILVKAHR